ncbi:MAG TPA: hypothetical protein VFG21_02315 [Xanthomonadaceae bacterium]|nr:hypothetical protein [Xanthomonadaceae bacterium]
MVLDKDRRNDDHEARRLLKRELNDSQLATLNQLEQFGWELRFIRRPMFQPSIAVVFDSSRSKFAVLEHDGTLNESPPLVIRD